MRSKAAEILHSGTVIPAIPLCLDCDRKFNENGQRLLLRYYLNAGVGGIAVAVHTTQFAIRKPEIGLFEPVVSVTIDEIKKFEESTGKSIVKIVGVCGETEQAVKEAEFAKSIGADAVLLSPSGLQMLTENEMLERTWIISSIMPVIGFYLQPSVGGRLFTVDYWKRLADINNVVAVKCAPFNRYQTLDLVRGICMSDRCDEIALYTGNDDNIVADLITKYEFNFNGRIVEKRFVGGLLGHWAVWTNATVKLFEKIRENPADIELLTLGVKITDANAAFFDSANGFKGCISGIHEVLRRQGLMDGIWCLDPDETLSDGQSSEIDRVYTAYPELNDDEFIRANIDKWI